MKRLLCTLALLAASTAASANIVSNGDFSGGGTGWILSGNTDASMFFNGRWDDGASDTDAWLSQVIGTVAGATYAIRFDTWVSWGAMTVALDGAPLYSATDDGHVEVFVVATGDQSTLSFITHNDAGYNGLDNVVVERVTADVAEPAALALMGIGLGGLAGMGVLGRRRLERVKGIEPSS